MTAISKQVGSEEISADEPAVKEKRESEIIEFCQTMLKNTEPCVGNIISMMEYKCL